MGMWNYRIIKDMFDGEICYFICEVYYETEGGEKAEFYMSLEDFGLEADTVEDLRSLYDLIGDAFNQPILSENGDGDLVEVEDNTEDKVEEEEAEGTAAKEVEDVE